MLLMILVMIYDLDDENGDVVDDVNYDEAFKYLCCCVHACITV